MNRDNPTPTKRLARRLAEAEATIAALLSGQIDAVVDPNTRAPVLLAAAQEALRDSEERHRRIVETTNEGICTVDTAGAITFVNRRFLDMLGRSSDDVLGHSMLDFVPAATRASAAERLPRSQRGELQEDEVRLVRRDGTELWLLLKASPIRDADGRHIGTLAMMTDRTRHRASEEALRRSERQYREIVEATTDGIMQLDVERRIVFVNRRMADILGYEAREIIGKNISEFKDATANQTAIVVLGRAAATGTVTIDTTFRHRNGTDVAVNLASSRLVDADGQHIGDLGVVRDMTERNKLQSQLMVSDRMASVGTLAAGVAHEINNPLAAVMSSLEYVVEGIAGTTGALMADMAPGDLDAWMRERLQAPLDDALHAAERVRTIVRDLKMFSRSPTEELLGPVDAEAVMESSLRMAWNEIRHRARLVKEYHQVPNVFANDARLGQVFLNLVVNAAQSLPEGRAEQNEVRVGTRVDGNRVVIEVQDTGVGIPPEIIGRIFDVFFTTKAVGAGTGLGLAICQRIVKDMGGELTVVSEVGKGSTFRVALPMATTRGQRITEPPAIEAVATRRGRILIVDDEAAVARSVERILRVDHEVAVTTTAADALERFTRGETFDVIFCDLMMPNMTGMELHRALLRVAPIQAAKMVFLTGGAFTTTAQRDLAESTNEYLEKPLSARALRAVVARRLA